MSLDQSSLNSFFITQSKEVDFAKYSSIKVGKSQLVYFILPRNLEDFGYEGICSTTSSTTNLDNSLNTHIIGKASNILLGNSMKNILILDDALRYIKDLGECIEVGAKTGSRTLFNYFKNNNLAGAEFILNIPGNIGGLVYMNAGLKHRCMREILLEINVNGKWQNIKNFDFLYRNSQIEGIIYAVRLRKNRGFDRSEVEIFKNMRSNQPLAPSLGSTFKNPKDNFAGALLEQVGLKGFSVGGAQFSPVHANFLINFNNASFEDCLELIKLAKMKVKNRFNISLDCEIKILD